jgi:hypothetical protein
VNADPDNDRASTALRVLIDHARATAPEPEGHKWLQMQAMVTNATREDDE